MSTIVLGITSGMLGCWLYHACERAIVYIRERRRFKAACKRYGISTARLYSTEDES